MEYTKGKAYGTENQTLFFDGSNFLDFEGDVITDLPEKIGRKPEYDKYFRKVYLESEKKRKIKEGTWEYPKDKTPVKVYLETNSITYGIVWVDEIVCADNRLHKVKDSIFEPIEPTKEQKKILLELYEARDNYNELDLQIYDLETKRSEIWKTMKETGSKINKAFDVLGEEEFVSCFENNLNTELKREMKEKGYKISFSSNLDSHKRGCMYIERTVKFPDKYGLNMEYDHDEYEYRFYCSTYKAQKAAMKQIEENSRKICVVTEPEQQLDIGSFSKKELALTESYVLTPQELSEKEAKRLAEEFCSHMY